MLDPDEWFAALCFGGFLIAAGWALANLYTVCAAGLH